ncbi:MAG: hypothetical protein U5K77_01860 [Candidatus Saccharibacteria bacterium]|nr:hypothetical protein [Candidatus Saccharibacteria bacterium]
MKQTNKDTTSAIVDGLLRFVAAGGMISIAFLSPLALPAVDKPTRKMLEKLDERERERELRRVVYYMKQRGLIRLTAEDYEHGLQITRRGRKRLQKANYDNVSIPTPDTWDKCWRLVLFDIPVDKNRARRSLTIKLRELGFKQLQKSIWIHPFPCRHEIEVVATTLGVRRYITYLEVSHIDAEKKLRSRFKHLLSTAKK